MVLNSSLVLLALACASCGAGDHHAIAGEAPSTPLVGPRRETLDARALAQRARLTVLIFFSPECPSLSAHGPRLLSLFEQDHLRGVEFFMVDSEVGGSPERDAAEARNRGYPFPILRDPDGKLADALGAEYAGYAVVFDSTARVRYHGGIDTDRAHLRDDATAYLANALDDLLADREPRVAEGKTLGCSLQKW